LEEQPKAANAEINDLDDQLIKESVAELVPKMFRRKRLQSGNQSIQPIESSVEKSGDSDGGDDTKIAIAKRTYQRKRGPSTE
jgi:hypothetical protein